MTDIFDKLKESEKRRLWTKSAVYCYNRGCNCKGCYYKEFFKDSDKHIRIMFNIIDEYDNTQTCKMNETVLELVRKFGKPDIEKLYPEPTKEVLEKLYLVEKKTQKEIIDELHIDRWQFNNLLDLYNIPKRKHR